MRKMAVVVSCLSLVVLTAPAVVYLAGWTDRMDLDMMKQIMFWASIVWFVTAPMYMWNEEKKGSS